MENFKNLRSEKFIKVFDVVRKDLGVSQAELARMIGYSKSANITQIRSGKNRIQNPQLKNFCDLFGYSYESFEEENGPWKKNTAESALQGTAIKQPAEIQREFEAIEKTNEMFLRMFETGIQLTQNNSRSFQRLRGLIGA